MTNRVMGSRCQYNLVLSRSSRCIEQHLNGQGLHGSTQQQRKRGQDAAEFTHNRGHALKRSRHMVMTSLKGQIEGQALMEVSFRIECKNKCTI